MKCDDRRHLDDRFTFDRVKERGDAAKILSCLRFTNHVAARKRKINERERLEQNIAELGFYDDPALNAIKVFFAGRRDVERL